MAAQNMPERVADQRKLVVEKLLADMAEKGMRWPENGWARLLTPRNATTGAAYRGINRMHLAAVASLRGFEDQRWVTFNQAKKAGWRVRRGARSCVVEKWKLFAFTKPGVDGGDDEPDVGEKVVIPRCVGCWSVFNAEEVDGVPSLPACGSVATDAAGNTADRFIASSRCPVDERLSDEAYYSPAEDKVTVPLRSQFAANEGFLRVLLHEMTHSTMVPLARDAGGLFGTPGYAREELVAELGSMFAAADAGFDCAALTGANAGNAFYGTHVGYLQSWMSALRDDPDELFRAAAKASAAADYLVGRLAVDDSETM